MSGLIIRELVAEDFTGWVPLWDGYNQFYGRVGPTALNPAISQRTWARLLDPREPMHALVALDAGRIVGLAHYLFHQSTSRPDVCYLQDLFTGPEKRGRGVGRALIQAVYEKARAAGADRVYWHTHESNTAGRTLYDQVGRHAGFIVYTKDF